MPPRPSLTRLPLFLDDVALIRAQSFPRTRIGPIAQFSTTNSLNAAAKNANRGELPKKGRKTLKIKRNIRAPDLSKGTPEQRKAFRTRIVLSNNNANDVKDLENLNAENYFAEESIGKVFTIPGAQVEALRTLGAFKRNQGWHHYKLPSCLIRQETYDLGQLMKEISEATENPASVRKLIHGERKSGKSVILLQALSMAMLKQWVVINMPESREWIDSLTSDYNAVRNTNPTQYFQKAATQRLLSQIVQINRAVLSKIKVSQDHNLPVKDIQNMTLFQLAEAGANDQDIAWPVFQALWTELNVTNSEAVVSKFGKRPPVLFCADNISYLFSESQYQALAENDKMKPIHSLDLLLPRLFVDHLTGAKKLSNGGIVLGASSFSQFVSCPPLDVGIDMGEERLKYPNEKLNIDEFWNPLFKIDRRVLDEVQNLDILKLTGIPKEQARGIIEYWALSGLVRDHVAESYINQKWTLSGGGIIGELEKAVVSRSLTAGT